MDEDHSECVRLLETLPGPGIQYLRLMLCNPQRSEAMPGQYCQLANQTQRWTCNYISMPGAAGRFMVATRSLLTLQVGDLLEYSGPLGSAWPVPLQSVRLLAITHGEGVLALLCTLDEVRCWLPWVEVRLLHESFEQEHLPAECQPWISAFTSVPRNSRSVWIQLTEQLEDFKPDTVYCCAPSLVARHAARICWQKGVPIQRIWLRADHVSRPSWSCQFPLNGPVQRYDRILEALNSAPPSD
ncbi:hypothetical protein ACNFB1_08785 [Pseudomonas sp. NY15349]